MLRCNHVGAVIIALANVLAWSTWDDSCETFWLGMDLGRRRA
jgi:hypothetical protein